MTSAFYLDGSVDPVFAMFDEPPAGAAASSTAVLICPPIGWQDVSSYRPRRDWARTLAAAGHPTLRIDLPGSGDSGGGPRDPDRLTAWTTAIAAAARWLRESSGCERVAAIGFGLGAIPLYQAVSDGAPLDELVLWALEGRGRRSVREQKAFARMELANQPESEAPVVPEGALMTAGFLFSAETLQALESFDVDRLPAPLRVRRALLLGRDGLAVDERVGDALRAGGVELQIANGDGFADMMMAEPPYARLPATTVSVVTEWLKAGGDDAIADRSSPGDSAPVAAQAEIELAAPEGGLLRETPVFFDVPAGRMFGILAEPIDARRELTTVLLNPGAVRRTGVNRMWVELARRWAARGVTVFRVDLEAIGDADGDGARYGDVASFYEPRHIEQVRAALDAAVKRGAPQRFVLVGLCSGSNWAFHSTRADPRVVAAIMINTGQLVFNPHLDVLRRQRRAMQNAVSARSVRRWLYRDLDAGRLASGVRKAATGAAAAVRAKLAAEGRSDETPRQVAGMLDELHDHGKRVTMIFTAEEPLYEELGRDGYLTQPARWPNLQLVDDARLRSGTGEDHTLRPLWLQRYVHELLDVALDRELEQLDQAGPSVSSAAGRSGPR